MRFAGHKLCERARPGPGNAVTRQHTKSQQQREKEIPEKADRGQQPLAALVKRKVARWTRVIKAAGVGAE